jgi:hypothetical protein
MNRADIHPGKLYAVREPPRPDVSFQRVKVLEHARKDKWKVEFLDEPNPGLVDYVRSKNIICRWGERKAVERDEKRADALDQASRQDWLGDDHPVSRAVDLVLESTGEDMWAHKGVLSGRPDAIQRLADRASIEIPDPRYVSYTDRRGEQHFPWSSGLALAKAFAAAEPATVLLRVEQDERELELKAQEPGYRYLLGLLESYRPSYALVRSWAGFDAELAAKDAEIERLREIIRRVCWDIKRDGQENLARRLERQLKGG